MTASEDVGTDPSTRTERAALATTSSAHFVHDGIADSLYVLMPMWAQAFGLNYTQVGSLKMAYSAAMAMCQMPAGVLAERWGERRLLAAGTVVAGLAFASLALAGGYIGLLVLILLVGLGSSVQHPLASSVIARAFAAGRRRAALGVYNFCGDLGKMIVAFGVAVAAGHVGWQAAVTGYGWLVAVIGAGLLLVLAGLALGGRPPAREVRAAGEPQAPATSDWGITNRAGLTVLSAIHVIDSASRTGTLTLLPFLLIGKGASSASVGLALSLIFAGGAMGKLACGLLADRVGLLRTVALTELATALLVLAMVPASPGLMLALMLPLGIGLNGTSSVLYGTVTDFVRPDRQARAFGMFYTVGSFAGGVAPLVLGALSDWIGLTRALVILALVVLTTLPLAVSLRPHLVSRSRSASRSAATSARTSRSKGH